MQAVVLAGGKGTRLKPYTTVIPKPLMPIGDIPILELVIHQLKHYGFTEIIITIGHLANLITAVFGNGEKLGVNIRYFIEDEPLGTAGCLALLENLDEDFLVLNGDLLTTLNYLKLWDFHLQTGAAATISTYKRSLQIDFGVIESSHEQKMKKYIEKPTYDFHVSMGINCINKNVLSLIAKGKPMDMPDFMGILVENNRKVMCYSDDCYWLDIGRMEDYAVAIQEFSANKQLFLKSNKDVD